MLAGRISCIKLPGHSEASNPGKQGLQIQSLALRAINNSSAKMCVPNRSPEHAAVSINADCLLISSVLQADGTDDFILPPRQNNFFYQMQPPTICGALGCGRSSKGKVNHFTKGSFSSHSLGALSGHVLMKMPQLPRASWP